MLRKDCVEKCGSLCRPSTSSREFFDLEEPDFPSWLEEKFAGLCNNVAHVVLKIGDERRRYFHLCSWETGRRCFLAMLFSSLAVALGGKEPLMERLKRHLQQSLKGKKVSANGTGNGIANAGSAPPPPSAMAALQVSQRLQDPVSEMRSESTCCVRAIDEALPDAMLMEIMSRLPDARDLVSCTQVNKSFQSSSKSVKSVRFVCKLDNIRAKNDLSKPPFRFRDSVTGTLDQLKCVETLVLEIEDEIMLANRLKTEQIEKNSLWLTERPFIKKWLDPVKSTLQNLTVIDYGQQAIFRPTNLLQQLAANCKQVRTLELRNVYLDCHDIGIMSKITTLTLRCVKLSPYGLKDINDSMPALEILTLVTVVGLRQAEFTSENLRVLCLGLATKVDFVKLNTKNLVKLQLKMACPENLLVIAPELKCLAVCMDKREGANVEFKRVQHLKELLMGASEFRTLKTLSLSNRALDKVFLDVPCMAFEDSGSWKGILNVPLDIPDMESLRSCCPNLQTMSVGPGLWYALEKEFIKNGIGLTLKWPTLERLILHLIVRENRTSMDLLTALVKAIPSLVSLEVYVHTDCRVGDAFDFGEQVQREFPHLEPICDTWKKGLRFECFSF